MSRAVDGKCATSMTPSVKVKTKRQTQVKSCRRYLSAKEKKQWLRQVVESGVLQ